MSMPHIALLRAPAPAAGRRPRTRLSTRALARRPAVALLGALALLLAAVIVVAVSATTGGDRGPATGAAAVVPGDALAYVHVSTDDARPEVKRALQLAARFPDSPLLIGAAAGKLERLLGGGTTLDFTRDVRPWLGKEAALALLGSGSPLGVLDVSNRAQALRFLTVSGAAPAGIYRSTRLYRYPAGTELAFVRHYLVLGADAGVRAAIDVAPGGAGSLAASAGYRRSAADEPTDRVLDAYATAQGLRRLLESRPGLLGALGTLLDRPTLSAVSVSLSPTSDGARIQVHTTLARAVTPRPFAPALDRDIPSGSALMFDTTGLDRVAPTILAAAARAGVGQQVAPLLGRLGAALTAEGVNVKSILSIFHGESALAITPGTSAPSLTLLARPSDPQATRQALAELEAPLSQLFSGAAAAAGVEPVFNDRQVAGVTAHQLVLAPGLQLDYAVTGGLVIVSTSLDAIAQIVERHGSLAQERAFERTLSDRPQKVTSLVFLDFSQLLSLGEQMGLAHGAGYDAVRPDLEKIRAVGVDSTSGETDTTAELSVQIP